MMTLALTAVAFTACSSDDDESGPVQNNTKLWPAYSSSDKLWGYINENGEWAIKPQFSEVHDFSCGLARVEVAGSKEYYINTNGEYINGNAKFDEGEDFKNNYAVVEDEKGVNGLVDRNINMKIQMIYSSLGDVASNGLMYCKASSSGKYGYINTDNEKVIDYQFDNAYTFHGEVAAVKLGDSWGLIGPTGNYVVTPKYISLYPLGNGMYAFGEKTTTSGTSSSSYLYGMMNASGKIIVQPIYKYIRPTSVVDDTTGRFAVQNSNGQEGYIDTYGKEIVECQYSYAGYFRNGYAFVINGANKRFIIDASGNIHSTLEDGEVLSKYSNGLFRIEKVEAGKRTTKYVNLEGKTVYMWVE